MSLINGIFGHQKQIGVGTALSVPVIYVAVRLGRRKGLTEKDLGPIFSLAITGGAIPEALLLIWCSFDPQRLPTVENYPLYLGIAALCALVLAGVAIRGYFKNI